MITLQIARERAVTSAERGRNIAAVLKDRVYSEMPPDYVEVLTYAHRVARCNQESNVWYAEDLSKGIDELFTGWGRFWYCNSRLCPECLRRSSRRNRSVIREAFNSRRLSLGESRRFITFTVVNHGLSLQKQRELTERTWRKFTKTAYYRRHFLAGFKNEEFTITKTGVHYHIHCLAITKYLHYYELRTEWTKCYQRAAESLQLPVEIKNQDKLLTVNVAPVRSLDDAINEVCKYITKSVSWHQIPAEDLFDVVRLRRFPRMFERLGEFTENSGGVRNLEASESNGGFVLPKLHTNFEATTTDELPLLRLS